MDDERERYPRTPADEHAEDFADMADKGGLWEGIRPFERPIRMGYFERRRMIKAGHAAIEEFLKKQAAAQSDTDDTSEK